MSYLSDSDNTYDFGGNEHGLLTIYTQPVRNKGTSKKIEGWYFENGYKISLQGKQEVGITQSDYEINLTSEVKIFIIRCQYSMWFSDEPTHKLSPQMREAIMRYIEHNEISHINKAILDDKSLSIEIKLKEINKNLLRKEELEVYKELYNKIMPKYLYLLLQIYF